MNILQGLAILLTLQSLGEVLAKGLTLPFPGPVVGMVLVVTAWVLKALMRTDL
jgi:putative effector of murein hydrolase LrgA (UPF0299 family)